MHMWVWVWVYVFLFLCSFSEDSCVCGPDPPSTRGNPPGRQDTAALVGEVEGGGNTQRHGHQTELQELRGQAG